MSRKPARPPVVVVHDLGQAAAALRAAQAAGVSVTLWSAPGAARYGGLGYLDSVFAAAADAVPGTVHDRVVDCGSSAVLAHEALRSGFACVAFSGRGAMRVKLQAVALARGARLLAGGPGRAALDLAGSESPERDCAAFLHARG